MPIPTYEPSYGAFITDMPPTYHMPYENPGDTKMSPKVYVDLPEATLLPENCSSGSTDPSVCDQAEASGRMAHLGFLYATCKFNISTGDSIMVKDSCPTKVILD